MKLTIVYMIAGLSSRFKGLIKPLAKVGPNGETLIEYSINQAINSEFNKIIFIVSEHTKKQVKKEFGDDYNGIPIIYVLQKHNTEKRDKPWGTCDAICSATEFIQEPFVVCAGDDIYGKKTFEILTEHLRNSQSDATAGKKLIEMLPEVGDVNRGIFEINKNNDVINIREIEKINRKNINEKGLNKNTATSISIFALHPETLKLLNEKLKKFKEENKDDRKIECYLNVKLGELLNEGKIKIRYYETPEKWLGITNPSDEIKIRNELIKKDKK